MSALPLNDSLAKVRALLPVKIAGRAGHGLKLVDRDGNTFCTVPTTSIPNAMARAELIRDAMNEML